MYIDGTKYGTHRIMNLVHAKKSEIGKKYLEDQKEAQRKRIAEQELRKQNDRRLVNIKNKFAAGQKLTADELNYLRERDPNAYEEAQKIALKRKALEEQIKNARTKEEADAAYTMAMTEVGIDIRMSESPDQTLSNQYSDAYLKYRTTREYKAKDDMTTQAEHVRASINKKSAERLERELSSDSDGNDVKHHELELKKNVVESDENEEKNRKLRKRKKNDDTVILGESVGAAKTAQTLQSAMEGINILA